MKKKMIFIPFFFIGIVALLIWGLMHLWNWLVPDVLVGRQLHIGKRPDCWCSLRFYLEDLGAEASINAIASKEMTMGGNTNSKISGWLCLRRTSADGKKNLQAQLLGEDAVMFVLN